MEVGEPLEALQSMHRCIGSTGFVGSLYSVERCGMDSYIGVSFLSLALSRAEVVSWDWVSDGMGRMGLRYRFGV